jgi:toxin HigB-1
MGIKSFSCRDTATLWQSGRNARFANIASQARKKLSMIDDATGLDDLRSPPGNRLEKLSADRLGQHSIRINDQWRICFVWTGKDAEEVEIVDYH